jgi:hypothetical protein
VLAPSGLVMMAMAPLSARITNARGPKATLMLGAAVVAAGYGAMPALVMGAVPRSETAAANSLNTLMRSIGTSTSSAVAGVVLAQLTFTFGGVAVPSQGGFRVVMAIGAGAALVALAIASFLPGRRAQAGRQLAAAGADRGSTVPVR